MQESVPLVVDLDGTLVPRHLFMHDDPLVFAARDRVSLVVAALGGAIIWMAM